MFFAKVCVLEDLSDRSERKMQVVVPAHQAEKTLPLCLTALISCGFANDEILIVDDGSTDATGRIAEESGVRMIRNETPQRPARARNRGAEASECDVLVFVDSDVVVQPDFRDLLEHYFKDPDLDAVIGSYDAEPGGPVVSAYRNLLHHVTHQASAGLTQTFWSGIGAIRRTAFEKAGGFDPAWEDIEDVELGLRVTAAGGTILLDPHMQGKHLKIWTLRSMFKTDLFGRAVPWSRLLVSKRLQLGALNTAWPHRVSVAAILTGLIGLLIALLDARAMWIAALAMLVFVVANVPLLLKLSQLVSPVFAVRAIPYHMMHYVAALLGYLRVQLLERRT